MSANRMLDNKFIHITEHAQAVAAKTATGLSVGGAGASLLVANEVIQIVAGIVAIVAGLAAAWWHFERIYDAHVKRRNQRDNDRSGSGPKGDSS